MATSATGVRDAALNLGAFGATAPTDAAGPIARSVSTTGGTTIGSIQTDDTITITFSEPLKPATVPALVTLTETDPSGAGNDTLTISGITNGARSTGSDSYITLDGGIADFNPSSTTLSNGDTAITVTVAGSCANTGCAAIGQATVAGSFSFAPAASLTDTERERGNRQPHRRTQAVLTPRCSRRQSPHVTSSQIPAAAQTGPAAGCRRTRSSPAFSCRR